MIAEPLLGEIDSYIGFWWQKEAIARKQIFKPPNRLAELLVKLLEL